MATEAEHAGWIPEIFAAISAVAGTVVLWIIRVSTRQARIEQKLDDTKEVSADTTIRFEKRLDKMDSKLDTLVLNCGPKED